MAKSKNHTNHNQNYKAHRNGIKRPKFGTKVSTKGMDPRFVRNQKHAKKGMKRAEAKKPNHTQQRAKGTDHYADKQVSI